jgi:AraC-like DNA-binding protein
MTPDGSYPAYIKAFETRSRHHENGSIESHFSYKNSTGTILTYPLYPGVILSFLDFSMVSIPVAQVKNFNRLIINYCFEGRCEVTLGENRVAFLEPESLSIDVNPARDCLLSPTGVYKGVELSLDFQILDDTLPSMFVELEIEPSWLKERFCPNGKSYLTYAPQSIAEVFEKMQSAQIPSVAFFKLATAELLFLLKELDLTKTTERTKWLTKGQTAIAKQVQERITRDLKQRFSITELASSYGISAASLKNYFRGVYGETISAYLRRIRMMKAKQLLQNTNTLVTDIAFGVGYENTSKFAAAFREYYGYSPLEYRRKRKCEIVSLKYRGEIQNG